jgi:hypothetical protein
MWNFNHAAPWSVSPHNRDRRSHHNRTKQHAQEEKISWPWEKMKKEKTTWTWEEIMSGHESLPWKQTQGEKGGQRRCRGSRPQREPKGQLK